MKLLLLATIISTAFIQNATAQNCVIILHGLSRTENSMKPIADKLEKNGFQVVNHHYPSRSATIPELSEDAIPTAKANCNETDQISFVTHSMGGIILRDYYARHPEEPRPFRVVMLAPPNQGSAIVDDPRYEQLGEWWMGPAGRQLSEKPNSYVNQLPKVDYPVGVIAGYSSINPYFSEILEGDDDGAVRVESTYVEGLTDWIAIKANHSFIMQNPNVVNQTLIFLQNGQFDKIKSR